MLNSAYSLAPSVPGSPLQLPGRTHVGFTLMANNIWPGIREQLVSHFDPSMLGPKARHLYIGRPVNHSAI